MIIYDVLLLNVLCWKEFLQFVEHFNKLFFSLRSIVFCKFSCFLFELKSDVANWCEFIHEIRVSGRSLFEASYELDLKRHGASLNIASGSITIHNDQSLVEAEAASVIIISLMF